MKASHLFPKGPVPRTLRDTEGFSGQSGLCVFFCSWPIQNHLCWGFLVCAAMCACMCVYTHVCMWLCFYVWWMLYEYNVFYRIPYGENVLPWSLPRNCSNWAISPPPGPSSFLSFPPPLLPYFFTSFPLPFFSSLLSFPPSLSPFSFLPPCRFWILNVNHLACTL